MARTKNILTDPLNWLLLLLAGSFAYYVMAVPYFTEFYLKTPQEMTLEDYLRNPSHPRTFMFHALSTPPSSIEIVLTDLTVAHLDQDSILLQATGLGSTSAAPSNSSTPPVGDGGDTEDPAAADSDSGQVRMLDFQPEGTPPNNEILIAGDNLDLLPVSLGQTVSLRVHALHESPLGWVPQELTLAQELEEYFNKDELDALEFMYIVVDGNETPVPYVEVGELRFASGVSTPGEALTLAELADDTNYIQTANRLAGATIDLFDVRVVDRRLLDRAPYFVVEDSEGRRARVFYNQRELSEWYWILDRLQDEEVVARGTLRRFAPGDLRQLEAEDNTQAVLDGFAILSRDGTSVFNLVRPIN